MSSQSAPDRRSLNIRITHEWADQLQEAADHFDVSVNDLVVRMVIAFLQEDRATQARSMEATWEAFAHYLMQREKDRVRRNLERARERVEARKGKTPKKTKRRH